MQLTNFMFREYIVDDACKSVSRSHSCSLTLFTNNATSFLCFLWFALGNHRFVADEPTKK